MKKIIFFTVFFELFGVDFAHSGFGFESCRLRKDQMSAISDDAKLTLARTESPNLAALQSYASDPRVRKMMDFAIEKAAGKTRYGGYCLPAVMEAGIHAGLISRWGASPDKVDYYAKGAIPHLPGFKNIFVPGMTEERAPVGVILVYRGGDDCNKNKGYEITKNGCGHIDIKTDHPTCKYVSDFCSPKPVQSKGAPYELIGIMVPKTGDA
ncbi:MAG: hypothetical protein AB7O96_14445 [Pseudobdellovibrionaceae bacterium]